MQKRAALGCLTIGNLGKGHRRHCHKKTKIQKTSDEENEENTFKEITDEGKSDEESESYHIRDQK